MDSRGNGGLQATERAQRFEIQMPLRYRVNGESQWRQGTTKNISCSGVLFRGEIAAQPNSPVEMALVLPSEVNGEGPAEVLCRGIVIRSERTRGVDSLPAVATRISFYRFIRP